MIKKFCDSTTESLKNNSHEENYSVVRNLAKAILTQLPQLNIGINPELHKELLEEIRQEGINKLD